MREDSPRVLIADDEPLLADGLERDLLAVWPDLIVREKLTSGDDAAAKLMGGDIDIAFLDIQMPGMTGLEVAQVVAEDWDGPNTPLIVFVTAYDEYAVQAFELAALDYLTKPVEIERLEKCRDRARAALSGRRDVTELASQLNLLLQNGAPGSKGDQPRLNIVRAMVGDEVQMIPVAEIIMFEAADKYVNVATATGNALIREPLNDLRRQLDPEQFIQVHRSRLVNTAFIHSARRDEDGKLRLNLRGRSDRPVVSRLYAGQFKAM